MKVLKISLGLVGVGALLTSVFYFSGNLLNKQPREDLLSLTETSVLHSIPTSTSTVTASTSKTKEEGSISRLDTSSWKSYKSEMVTFLYPPDMVVSEEKGIDKYSGATLKSKLFLIKSGVKYFDVQISCIHDPKNNVPVYTDYSTYMKEKFYNALRTSYQDFLDLDPVKTIQTDSNLLVVFKLKPYCEMGGCVGKEALLAAACTSGNNIRGNMSGQCFTVQTMTELNELENDLFINGVVSSVRLDKKFKDMGDCEGVGEIGG